MLLLGLLLMAASGAFVGLLVADNLSGGPDYQVTILGSDLVTLNSLSIFLAGVALALLFCLGLAMMRLSRHSRLSRRAGRTARSSRTARPVRRAASEDRAVGGTDELRMPPEERAAEQGGRETAARPGGRIRRMFGH
ncbi:hypothetical protein ACIQOW_09820 [Kitasatospora sp. NPDC091335]|uniref:hypothetical protein n=1 Tax=Kitasatospora sp. NPDC091335 TaxID=3364085 RepID=UPI00381B5E8D